MPRGPRSNLTDHGFFHAYSRGVDHVAIVRDDLDRAAWLSLLQRTADRFAWTCHAYCLMPNHFHLVVETELTKLSSGMHQLNGLYAARFNRRHDRTGHLFQGRFGVRLIDDEEYCERACAYVVENPVRAGLCESADDWPWAARALVAPALERPRPRDSP